MSFKLLNLNLWPGLFGIWNLIFNSLLMLTFSKMLQVRIKESLLFEQTKATLQKQWQLLFLLKSEETLHKHS